MIRPEVPHEQKEQAVAALKQALRTIINVGDATQQDRSTNSRYVNIIIDINKIINELNAYSN